MILTTINAVDYIKDNWVDSPQSNFFTKEILARGANIGVAVGCVVSGVFDTLLSLTAVGAIFTAGKFSKLNDLANLGTIGASMNPAFFCASVLRVVNPHADILEEEDENLIDGLASRILEVFKTKIEEDSQSSSLFKRHVTARLTCVVLAVAALVTRIVDGIIGLVATILAFGCLGKSDTLNTIAFEGLMAPLLINDLFYCTLTLINPQALNNNDLNF